MNIFQIEICYDYENIIPIEVQSKIYESVKGLKITSLDKYKQKYQKHPRSNQSTLHISLQLNYDVKNNQILEFQGVKKDNN